MHSQNTHTQRSGNTQDALPESCPSGILHLLLQLGDGAVSLSFLALLLIQCHLIHKETVE